MSENSAAPNFVGDSKGMKWKDRLSAKESLERAFSNRGFKVRAGNPVRGYWQMRIPFQLRGGSVSRLSKQASIVDLANEAQLNPMDISIKTINGTTHVDLLLDTTDRTVVKVTDRPQHWPHKLADFYQTESRVPKLQSRPQNPLGFWVGAGFSGWASVQINAPSEPHLLITGTSGSGKSMFLANILDQINDRHPRSVKLYVIDPNRVLSLTDHMRQLEVPRSQNIEDGRKMLLSLAEMLDDINSSIFRIVVIDELSSVLGGAPADVRDAWSAITKRGRGLGVFVIAATQKALAENVGSDARAQLLWRAIGSFETDEEFRMTVANKSAVPHRIPGSGAFYIYRVQSRRGINIRAPYVPESYLKSRFGKQVNGVVNSLPQAISGGNLENFLDVVRWIKEGSCNGGISQNDLQIHLRDVYGRGSVATARAYKNRLIQQGVISSEKNTHQKHDVLVA